jgi:hypothetical protein
MSLTQNLNIIPFSLTGLQNITATTINGNPIYSGNVNITFTSALIPSFIYDTTTNTIILNLPYSSALNSGIISNSEWSTFNNKVSSVSGLIGVISPLYVDNTDAKNPIVSFYYDPDVFLLNRASVSNPYRLTMNSATSSTLGYLTASDWVIFNNKENVLTFSSPLIRTLNDITIPNIKISTNTPSNTYNDFFGYLAGGSGSGDFNVCLGRRCGVNFTTAQENVLIGYTTGDRITTGNNNIMINCNPVITTGSNNIIIGNNNLTTFTALSYSKVLGNFNNINHDTCNVIGNNITTQDILSSYMSPIRNVSNTMMLSYNTTTKEITYESKPTSGVQLGDTNVWTASNTFNSNIVITNQNQLKFTTGNNQISQYLLNMTSTGVVGYMDAYQYKDNYILNQTNTWTSYNSFDMEKVKYNTVNSLPFGGNALLCTDTFGRTGVISSSQLYANFPPPGGGGNTFNNFIYMNQAGYSFRQGISSTCSGSAGQMSGLSPTPGNYTSFIIDGNATGEGVCLVLGDNQCCINSTFDTGYVLVCYDEDAFPSYVGYAWQNTSLISYSERRFKDNIKSLDKLDILDKFNKINFVEYTKKRPKRINKKDNPIRYENSKHKYSLVNYGVIHDEIIKIFPDIEAPEPPLNREKDEKDEDFIIRKQKYKDADKSKMVDYGRLNYYSYLAVQELIKENTELKVRLDRLENIISKLNI